MLIVNKMHYCDYQKIKWATYVNYMLSLYILKLNLGPTAMPFTKIQFLYIP